MHGHIVNTWTNLVNLHHPAVTNILAMTGEQRPSNSSTHLNQRFDVNFALQAAGLGVWELDIVTKQLNWDDRCRALYGLTSDNELLYEQVIRFIHPDDLVRVDEAVQRAMAPHSDGHYDATYRTLGAEDDVLRWVRFQGKTEFTESGEPYRFAGVGQDVTQQVVAQQALEMSEARFRSMINRGPVAITVLRGEALLIETINQPMLAIMGRGEDIVGQPLEVVMPEMIGQELPAACRGVLHTGKPYYGWEVEAQVARNGRLQTGYFNVAYTPLYEESTITGVMHVVTEVTELVLSRQQIEKAQQQVFSSLERLPTGMGVLVMEGEDLIIRTASPFYGQISGRRVEDMIGKPLLEVRPEHKHQSFVDKARQVMATGEDFTGVEEPVQVLRDNQLETIYTSFVYTPQYHLDGTISGVIVIFIDVTDQIRSRQAVEASQQQLVRLFEQSPVGIATLDTHQLTFRMVNPFYGYLVGRSPDQIVGKPFLEAFPELAGQEFDEQLRAVIATGIPFIANEVAVTLIRNEQLETIYVDLTYQPQYQGDHVTGVFMVATDVTQQVTTRQKIETSEALLQSIVTHLPSATVLFRGPELVVELPSQYFIDIIDRGPDVTGKPLGELMPELESQSFLKILSEVYTSGQSFRAFGTPVLIQQADGTTTNDYFDLIYTPLFDDQQQVYAILSVATNVTDVIDAHQQLEESEVRYRTLSESLDQQVQQRTGELEAINEELAATNQELTVASKDIAAANSRLEEANRNLIRSNQNLEQFAYIASHDLQEPLRKIQSFGDLLKSQYTAAGGEELAYLDRMQSAASRMSLLIKDLLAFSRISTNQASTTPVHLSQLIQDAWRTCPSWWKKLVLSLT